MSYQPEIDKIREILKLYQETWIEGDHTVSAPSLALDIYEATGKEIAGKRLERFLANTRPLRSDEIDILREFLGDPDSNGFYCSPDMFGRRGISAAAAILNLVNPEQEFTKLQDSLSGRTFSCSWMNVNEEYMYASFSFSRTDVDGVLKLDLCRREQETHLDLPLEERLRPTHHGWITISKLETATIVTHDPNSEKNPITYSILAFEEYEAEASALILLEHEYPLSSVLVRLEDTEIINMVNAELIHNIRVVRASSLSTRATAGVNDES